jgi:hypothetical protein
VGTVTALPRDGIASISLEPGDAVSALRGSINHQLIGGGSGVTIGQQADQDDLFGFLAGIRTDPGWIHPPQLPYGSTQYLKAHFRDYAPAERPWQAGHPLVHVNDLVVDPGLFTGGDPAYYGDDSAQVAPYAFRGQLIETAVGVAHPAAGTENRLFTIASGSTSRSEAYCYATVSTHGAYRVGQTVDLLGIVVAWGRYNQRAGAPVDEVALVCSTVRKAPHV